MYKIKQLFLILGKVDEAQLWLTLELMREAKHWLPSHGTSGEEEDDINAVDPERQVLFDQLQGFLYAFGDPRQIFKLLLAWLHFLGLDFYHESQHELGLLGTQTFHSWLNVIHPEVVNIGSYIHIFFRIVLHTSNMESEIWAGGKH